MSALARVLAILLLAGTAVPLASEQGQLPAGTGSIAGTIVADDAARTPVRRAIVSVRRTDDISGATAITDDSGRFAFLNLPAARYTLSATKPGFVFGKYGAKRASRPGTPIPVTDGQRTTVTFALVRTAVVTGTVRHASGEPVQFISVRACRITRGTDGVPHRSSEHGRQTDDRGVYRLFGLEPGEYIIETSPNSDNYSDTRPTTAADIQAVKAPATGGGSVPLGPTTSRGATFTFVSVMYPDATAIADAKIISLAAGEERAGIDITLRLVATSMVSGTVTGADGGKPTGELMLILAPIQSDEFRFEDLHERGGTPFYFTGLKPGRYSLIAYQQPGSSETVDFVGGSGRVAIETSSRAAGDDVTWASSEIVVSGQDIKDVSLRLQPGLKIRGRLSFDAESGKAPPAFESIEVRLQPAHDTGVSVSPKRTKLAADGAFEITGIVPGPYRLQISTPDSLVTGIGTWIVQRATYGSQDIADLRFDVLPTGGDQTIAAVLTDRGATLSGALVNTSGAAATDYFIVLFPVDRKYWSDETRRLQVARPGTDGRYEFRNMAAGEYYLAALTDVEPGEWKDPNFLDQIVPASIRMRLAAGERRVQDIRINGGW